MKRLIASTIACLVLVQPVAALAERPAPRAKHHENQLPPHWRTWILIGRCEMPVQAIPGYRGNRWKGIAWNQTRNWSYNGLGLTILNWETFRRSSQRHVDAHEATPLEQLWSAERLWRWANREYPGNGWTAWECSRMIGWTTSDPDDALEAAE